jgi:glucans biosynthesis protein C
MVLVIAHHTGQAYGPTGGWGAYQETVRADWLGPFFTVNRSFFMSLFFFISGYFLPGAIDRKGAKKFFADRMLRFGIPLVFFLLLVIPVMHYVYFLNFRPYGAVTFPDYYTGYYFGCAARPGDWTGPAWPEMNFGHLWFIEHLLVFSGVYALWRHFRGQQPPADGSPVPGSFRIIVFTLSIAVVSIAVRLWYPIDRWSAFLGFIQVAFADVPRDLGWFVVGVIVARRNWLARFPARAGYAWFICGAVLAALYYVLAYLKLFPYTVYVFWESFLCTGMCIGIPVVFRELLNRQGNVARELAACSYGVYLFHVPVIVALQYALASAGIGPSLKFILVVAAASAVTWIMVYGFRVLFSRVRLAVRAHVTAGN